MTGISLEQFNEWLLQREDERFEFKEAKNQFDFERLARIATAMANEGGGRLIFGVTDTRPRRVVGSKAFPDLEHTCTELIKRLHIRVSAHRLQHPDGNVSILEIPSRPLGVPIQYKGMYLMRAGEDTVPMTPDRLREIFDEAVPDFSAQICPSATTTDLDPRAIALFRDAMLGKSRLASRAGASDEQLLEDAELIVDGGVTWAALVLLGTKRAVSRYLAQAEVVFEYRNSEASIPSQQREEFREGFLLVHDDIWRLVNLRNDMFQFQEGFIRRDIPTFAESTIREAILNAVSHRDYQQPGSIYIRQYPTRLEIESPGGFPTGVTPETILWKTVPRNRRIAEALTT
jgi:ATP-dependent DNA helicase RecG